ncbi:UPF0149 family protein [uncultured Sphingomonas sp.]|uniref:UPF0149 family protein n=1 Tax=uncultured Sphingomonas sp. TaxID=158754 RepID=UPI0035CBF8A8
MQISSPRLRRLDGALASLPPESDAMLLSELDGYLAGVVVCPELVLPGEWLPVVWGEDEVSPFEDEREAQWYAGLVVEHYNSIIASLAKGPGRYKPFLEADVRNDEILWELWIEGFAAAMDLRPDAWAELEVDGDKAVSEAFCGLLTLVEIALHEGALERDVIDRMTEEAPRLIPRWVETLNGQRLGRAGVPSTGSEPFAKPKAGRNEPCPCGSGSKYKKCCGLS